MNYVLPLGLKILSLSYNHGDHPSLGLSQFKNWKSPDLKIPQSWNTLHIIPLWYQHQKKEKKGKEKKRKEGRRKKKKETELLRTLWVCIYVHEFCVRLHQTYHLLHNCMLHLSTHLGKTSLAQISKDYINYLSLFPDLQSDTLKKHSSPPTPFWL